MQSMQNMQNVSFSIKLIIIFSLDGFILAALIHFL